MAFPSLMHLTLVSLIISVFGFSNFNHRYHPSSSAIATTTDSIVDHPIHMDTPVLFSESSKFHVRNDGLTKRRRWLVVDFDGTCTEHDTTPLLPKLASFASRSRSSLPLNKSKSNLNEQSDESEHTEEYDHEKDLQWRLSQFAQLEKEFLKRYSEAKSSMLSDETGETEQRLRSIQDALDALDEPSTTVTHMVSKSRVLHGLGHADSIEMEGMLNVRGISTSVGCESINTEMDKACAQDERIEVHLKPGCETTLARILMSHSTPNDVTEVSYNNPCMGWSLAILSINWCPALIDASLVQPVLRKKRSLLNQQHCETEVPIWSNNVDGEGVVTLHVPGAKAKRERIIELRKCLVQMNDNSEEVDTCSKHLIVYVGDSSTDLAALLEADVGIIMGNSESTRNIAEKWGIEIVPLKNRHEYGFDIQIGMPRGKGNKTRLWQVDNWQMINETLEELDIHWKC